MVGGHAGTLGAVVTSRFRRYLFPALIYSFRLCAIQQPPYTRIQQIGRKRTQYMVTIGVTVATATGILKCVFHIQQTFGKTVGTRRNKGKLRSIKDQFALIEYGEITSGVGAQRHYQRPRLNSVLRGADFLVEL